MTEQRASSLDWRKSSHSGTDGTDCVELAALDSDQLVAARDSKDPVGGTLAFSRGAWHSFVEQIKAGAFDASRIRGR
ncbi:DUF397 domain-containing protein [Actinomadura sp. 21ATH]|uniref:DUF397 domain-containing protein n=1 Tax=Actinomadura sp. 21ATH TaxID=1735444 RepID=UPI0035C2415C